MSKSDRQWRNSHLYDKVKNKKKGSCNFFQHFNLFNTLFILHIMTEENGTVTDTSKMERLQQVEQLSPLAVGDQKLNRHLGFFSGTMMNSKYESSCSLLPILNSLFLFFTSWSNDWHWYLFQSISHPNELWIRRNDAYFMGDRRYLCWCWSVVLS